MYASVRRYKVDPHKIGELERRLPIAVRHLEDRALHVARRARVLAQPGLEPQPLSFAGRQPTGAMRLM
jgi:hypothetical protein